MAAPSSSWLDHIPALSDDPTHPAQVALRTYALALSLSLGPSLVPFVSAVFSTKARARATSTALKRVLRRELGHDGFPFAITLAVAGGAALRKHFWALLAHADQHEPKRAAEAPSGPSYTAQAIAALRRILAVMRAALLALGPAQRTFLAHAISSAVGIVLIQAGRQRTAREKAARQTSPRAVDLTSPTLDLTLLVVVRAVDSIMQAFILQKPVPARLRAASLAQGRNAEPALVHARLAGEKIRRENRVRQQWTSQVDAFVFWACSARCVPRPHSTAWGD